MTDRRTWCSYCCCFCIYAVEDRNFSLMQRSTMQNAISAHKVGGIVRLTKIFILKGTLFVEMAGALALLPVFYHDFGRKGIWMAVFHSISAFCNAGFDILGTPTNPISIHYGLCRKSDCKCSDYVFNYSRWYRISYVGGYLY